MAADAEVLVDQVAAKLQPLIIGVAASVREAQAQLDQLRTETSAYAYHIPSLDFEMTVGLTLAAESGGSADVEASFDVSGVISGSIVAIPPPPSAKLSAHVQLLRGSLQVVATAFDSTGSPMQDVSVEFNVDREESEALNGRPLRKLTDVSPAVVTTDATGRALSTLTVADKEPPGTLIVLTVDALGRSLVWQHEVSS